MPEFAAPAVADLELSNPFPLVAPRAGAAHVLLRLHGRPLGFLAAPVRGGVIDADALVQHVLAAHAGSLAAPLVERAIAVGAAPGWPDVRTLLACRPSALAIRPQVTVAIRASGTPGALAACLASVEAQDYPITEVVVSDGEAGDARLMARCGGDIVVVVDDAVTLDRGWAGAAARAFVSDPDVTLLAGLTLPRTAASTARLDGSLLTRRWSHGPGARLVAMPPVVAFWRGALESAPAAPAAAIRHLLSAGHSALYEPAALAWHEVRLTTDPFASPAPAARTTSRAMDLGDAPRSIADANGCDRLHVAVTWHGQPVGRIELDHRGTVVSAFRLHDAVARELAFEALDTRLRIGRAGLIGVLTAELAQHLVARRTRLQPVEACPIVVTPRPAAA